MNIWKSQTGVVGVGFYRDGDTNVTMIMAVGADQESVERAILAGLGLG